MRKIPDDLPSGVRVSVILLRVFSYLCGIVVVLLTFAAFPSVVGLNGRPDMPIWGIDLALMILSLLATVCYTMNLCASGLEEAHSTQLPKVPFATGRMMWTVAADLLTGVCFVMIVGAVLTGWRMAGSENGAGFVVLATHVAIAIIAALGVRSVRCRTTRMAGAEATS